MYSTDKITLCTPDVKPNIVTGEGEAIAVDMEDNAASVSLKALSDYLCRYYGKKVVILLDEYDTLVQETYVKDYWEETHCYLLNGSGRSLLIDMGLGIRKDIFPHWKRWRCFR